jgi:hypothetical protein
MLKACIRARIIPDLGMRKSMALITTYTGGRKTGMIGNPMSFCGHALSRR